MSETEQAKIKTDSVRECRFYMRYMVNNYRTLKRSMILENFSDTKMCCRILNMHLYQGCHAESERKRRILELEFQYMKSIIPDDNFTWLNQDKRATFWMWGELALEGNLNQEINNAIGGDAGVYWYKKADLNLSPVNHEQRYQLIIDVIDYICAQSEHHAKKLIVWLNNTLIKWREAQKDIIHIKWLTLENERECFWAYEYIRKHQENTCSAIESAGSDSKIIDNFYPVRIPEPLTTEEAYLSFYAMHDLWSATLSDSQEVNTRMLKTHSQGESRRRKQAAKLQSGLADEVMDKLTFLAQHFRISKDQVIELLVNDRYKGIHTTVNSVGRVAS